VLFGFAQKVLAPPITSVASEWLLRVAQPAALALELAMFYGFLRFNGQSLKPMRWASER
jgi:hypothetical protein